MLQAWRRMSVVLHQIFEPEVRAWFGLEPLWKLFWGYGVLASAAIIAFYAVATIERRAAVQQLLLIFFAGYTIWILVSVWRCAAMSMPVWQTLARSLTVAWAANAVLVIFFLELDLIADWLRLSCQGRVAVHHGRNGASQASRMARTMRNARAANVTAQANMAM